MFRTRGRFHKCPHFLANLAVRRCMFGPAPFFLSLLSPSPLLMMKKGAWRDNFRLEEEGGLSFFIGASVLYKGPRAKHFCSLPQSTFFLDESLEQISHLLTPIFNKFFEIFEKLISSTHPLHHTYNAYHIQAQVSARGFRDIFNGPSYSVSLILRRIIWPQSTIPGIDNQPPPRNLGNL